MSCCLGLCQQRQAVKGLEVDCTAKDSSCGAIPAAVIRVYEQEIADNLEGNYLYDSLSIIHRKRGEIVDLRGAWA